MTDAEPKNREALAASLIRAAASTHNQRFRTTLGHAMKPRIGAIRFSPAFLLTLVVAVCAFLGAYHWLTVDSDGAAFAAVESGDIEEVERLITRHPSLLTENRYHTPSMMVTVALKHPDMLRRIAPFIHKRVGNRFRLWNALSVAVKNEDMTSVRILLQNGWDPNRGASSSLLVEALRHGNQELVELLLEHEADTTDALSWACEQGDSDLAARMLALGADPTTPMALANAVASGDFQTASDLVSRGANPAAGLVRVGATTPPDLVAAFVREGDFDLLDEDQQLQAIRSLFQIEDSGFLDAILSRIDLASSSRASRLLIDLAECEAAVDPVQKMDVLLRHGADPNSNIQPTNSGNVLHLIISALHFAVEDRISMARRLIDAGAEMDGAPKRYRSEFDTPLRRCVNPIDSNQVEVTIDRAHEEIAKLLIERGVSNTKAQDGSNYLHCAAQRKTPANDSLLSIVSSLIEAGVRLGDTDSEGRTPLHLAAASGNAEIAKMFVDAGADVTIESEAGETPLQVCERLMRDEEDADMRARVGRTLEVLRGVRQLPFRRERPD